MDWTARMPEDGAKTKIVVVGGGKMGLPLACMFAHNGASVTVCDVNPAIVDKINKGIDPHQEPDQDRYLRNGVAAGRLRASTDTSAEAAKAEAVVVLVSAVLTAQRDIDWNNLLAASTAVAQGLRKGTLVSYETTLPVGGCRSILVPALEQSGLKAGRDFPIVFSPERVKSRLVLARLGDTPKVIGGIDARSAAAGESFYRRWLGAPTINVGTLEAAEFVKLAGMIYRDVNIALANELAVFAEAAGLDVWPLLDAANTDRETHLLRPGIGVGGHCTPVYPYFLINGAARLGLELKLPSFARKINEAQPERHVARLGQAIGGLQGRRIHILGLAFRPQVREDAYSPAVPLQEELRAAGATVTLEDPLYSPAELKSKGFESRSIQNGSVDAVILNTAHPQFADPDFRAWRARGVQAVLDGRAFWSREQATAAGLTYLGIGMPPVLAEERLPEHAAAGEGNA
jgi:nucleotide sugar dehydrogenase